MLVDAARPMVGLRLSALRLPLFAGGESFWNGVVVVSRTRARKGVARTRFFFTSPRCAGRGRRARSAPRVRGPLRDSVRCRSCNAAADFDREAQAGGDAPSSRPSPRVRGEGGASVARTMLAVRAQHIHQEGSLSQIGRWFHLSEQHAHGVSCNEKGVFVGAVPLIEPCHGCAGLKKFQPRPLPDLNRDLSKCYGLPVDLSTKTGALAAIAQALSRGDMIHAQIATLHLQIPDPPPLAKGPQSATQVVALAKELRASGLLKEDWDPAKHPRWPAGSPGGIGGEFAPAGGDADEAATEPSGAPIIPAEITIPIPIPRPLPFEVPQIPFPREIVPPLGIYPRRELINPYPDREGCDEEWAEAIERCEGYRRQGLLGKDGYRGMGDFYQCVMGQVSERCGGSPKA
jgi:hypothetical protein